MTKSPTHAITKPCKWHKPQNLSYLAAHADADVRKAKGEKQQQCPDCLHWYWPHEMGKKKKTP